MKASRLFSFVAEFIFRPVNQTADVGMMPGYTHSHQQKGPHNNTGIPAAEKEGKNKEHRDKQHASDRNIPEKRDDRDGDSYTDQRGHRETIQHDSAGCSDTFSATEMKENRPVMTDDTEETGKHGAKMAPGNQPCKQAGKNPLQAVDQKSNDAVFPAHGTLHVTGTCAFASDSMQIGTVSQSGSNNASGHRTQKIANHAGQNIKDFLRYYSSFFFSRRMKRIGVPSSWKVFLK